MKHVVLLLLPLVIAAGCQHPKSNPSSSYGGSSQEPQEAASNSESAEPAYDYIFGWGSVERELSEPRGGTSRGSEVQLAAPEAPAIDASLSKKEQDRLAILSLAGSYRVEFHFIETLGLKEDYEPKKQPYFSWATEHVHVLENEEDFISLQHTLVMFFANENGVSEPMLMKHWRQDWTFEDTELHVFKGDRTWQRENRSEDSVAGAWSQAVFQVDDSPRYEVVGSWVHDGNRSVWTSETDWRPLPRREFSFRSDYGVLEGRHRIILTPTGWVHEQDNWKRARGESSDSNPEYLAQEWGLNRYERIVEPGLDTAIDYWEKTGDYWAEVRNAWSEVMEARDRFQVRPDVDGQSLFGIHFEYANRLAEGEEYDAEAARQHAWETVQSFVVSAD